MKNILLLFLLFSLPVLSVPDNAFIDSDGGILEESPFSQIELKIKDHIVEIEKLHGKIADYNPSMKKSIAIDQHVNPFEKENSETVSIQKYTDLYFKGSRLEEVHIGSKKRYLSQEYKFENRKLIYFPYNADQSKLSIETFDSRNISIFKDFTDEHKLKALKMVEDYLRQSVYKLEVLLHKYENRQRDSDYRKLSI